MILDFSIKTRESIIEPYINEIYVLENEEWIDISNNMFPGIQPWYMISSWGRVWSKLNNIYMNTRLIGHGYESVTLRFDKEICGYECDDILIHRLVKICFTPIENMDQYQINHKDNNIINNYLYNLEWCTNEYNNLYKAKMNERNMFLYYNNINPNILSEDELRVVEVCKLLEQGYSHKDICIKIYDRFDNSTRGTVAHIDHRRQWKYISEYYNVNQKQNAKRMFTDEQAHSICQMLQEGLSNSGCADMIGIDRTNENRHSAVSKIASIRRRECYTNITSQYNW